MSIEVLTIVTRISFPLTMSVFVYFGLIGVNDGTERWSTLGSPIREEGFKNCKPKESKQQYSCTKFHHPKPRYCLQPARPQWGRSRCSFWRVFFTSFRPFLAINFCFSWRRMYDSFAVNAAGGHTIGAARCVSFRQRLYNQDGNNRPDETIEKNYYNDLKSVCPKTGGDNNISPLDIASPVRFDNTYFKLILLGKGLLTSDQVLMTGKEAKTMELVKSYAEDEALFFHQFAKSMVNMGNISPLIGSQGEIRKNCHRINWNWTCFSLKLYGVYAVLDFIMKFL